MYNNYNSVSYSHLSKNLGYYNLSNQNKIVIYGKDAQSLINSFSIRDIKIIKENAFYTVLMKKKIFLAEVLIIRLSPYKYVLCFNNDISCEKLCKQFTFNKRKFPYVSIEIDNKIICLFSLHGKLNISNMNINSSLFKFAIVKHQSYIYPIIYSVNNKKTKIEEYLKLNQYENISIDNYLLFLYNNKVIININKLNKKFKLIVIKNIYGADNYNFKCKNKIITIKLFEATKNILIHNNMKIMNHDNKYIGYVYRSFHNPNKKNPFIIAIVYKYRCGKLAFINDSNTNNNILIRQRNIYN